MLGKLCTHTAVTTVSSIAVPGHVARQKKMTLTLSSRSRGCYAEVVAFGVVLCMYLLRIWYIGVIFALNPGAEEGGRG